MRLHAHPHSLTPHDADPSDGNSAVWGDRLTDKESRPIACLKHQAMRHHRLHGQ